MNIAIDQQIGEQDFKDLPDFQCFFPNVAANIQQVILKELTFFSKLYGAYPGGFVEVCDQISGKIKQWEQLKKQSNNKVVYHVYKMIYSLLTDKDFSQLSSKDQSILLWSSLLHDISKLGSPSIDGKDHCHPFKSGYEVLKIFHQLKFVNLSEDQLNEWEQIFKNAYIPCKKEKGKYLHNNEIVQQVKQFLDRIYGMHEINPQVEIIILVFFHQSLHLISKYPPQAPLEKKVYAQLFNDRFLDLMYFITLHDSRSYQICKPIALLIPNIKKLKNEVRLNISELKQFIKNNK